MFSRGERGRFPSWLPPGVLDVDSFMVMYPGLTPPDVLGMDLEWFEALPVVRQARVKAEGMRAAAGGPAQFGRRPAGG